MQSPWSHPGKASVVLWMGVPGVPRSVCSQVRAVHVGMLLLGSASIQAQPRPRPVADAESYAEEGEALAGLQALLPRRNTAQVGNN